MRRCLGILLGCLLSGHVHGQTTTLNIYSSDWVGIEQAAPSTSSSQLKFRLNGTSAKQALIYMDVIGDGPNQVPEGSEILVANLRLTAISGGDGLLYRAAEPWNGFSTWDDLGNVATIGASKGAGISTTLTIDVVDHVQAWADGTFSFGWVLKGAVNDTTDTEIYNGSASTSVAPRLQVVFIPPVPPDTTGPRIEDVDIGSTVSVHANYDIPAGSGAQIRTVPVVGINQIFVRFNEDVIGTASAFSLVSHITNTSYPGTVSYNSGTRIATFTLTNSITGPDQLILTVTTNVKDQANNSLDGEWTPAPTSVNSTGTNNFPSGNGSPGGNFVFYFTSLPCDFTHDNLVDGDDLAVWQANYGMTGVGQADGDTDGDGDVDGKDFLRLQQQTGINFTAW